MHGWPWSIGVYWKKTLTSTPVVKRPLKSKLLTCQKTAKVIQYPVLKGNLLKKQKVPHPGLGDSTSESIVQGLYAIVSSQKTRDIYVNIFPVLNLPCCQ